MLKSVLEPKNPFWLSNDKSEIIKDNYDAPLSMLPIYFAMVSNTSLSSARKSLPCPAVER